MNQRGEATVFGILTTLALIGLVLLSALEMKGSYRRMEKRTQLFLCVKETKGELKRYLRLMGQSNWAIKNLGRVKLIAVLIPPVAAAVGSAENLKEALIQFQNAGFFLYQNRLVSLKRRSCPLDPVLLKTPFQTGPAIYERDREGLAKLRSEEWTYTFLNGPYSLELTVEAPDLDAIRPKLKFSTRENKVISSFLSWFA